VFRTIGDQPGLWEAILPAELQVLPCELARVDALLDDLAFFAPFVSFFDPRMGRPSTPMETYLRMMFLTFRYRLGYESLCREVTDSITWRRFCRIPLDGKVPHPTTLMKLTIRCGEAAVAGCNEALLAKAAQAKLLRTTRLRADTTVVCADVPTRPIRDCSRKRSRGSRRPGDGSRPLVVRSAPGAGTAAGRRASGRTGSPRSCDFVAQHPATRGRPRCGGSPVSSPDSPSARADAQRLLANARRALRRAQAKAAELAAVGGHDAVAGRRRGRLHRAVNDLTRLIEATRRIAAQTSQRVAGHTPDGASRRVSLHEPDARPIAKGRLGKPVEFGYKGQVVDNDDGVVLDHSVHQGNPPDAPQLAPAIERVIKRTGRRPRTVTADRGYGEKRVDDALHDLGVRTVVIPRKGRPGKARQAAEHRPAFRKTMKWRTGCEGRISSLKRGYGWDRTRLDGTEGARIWTGHGILAHNLVKIGTLAG
jgi:transposase, IS5 family